MKIKYYDSYSKRKPVVVNGIPVVKDGKIVQTEMPMFLYAITSATPEELVLYKRFKRDNPDNSDYYRESKNGIPLWHDTKMHGLGELQVDIYDTKEGKVGFKVNNAMRGALEGIKAQSPGLTDKVNDALWALMTAGTPVDINTLTSPIAQNNPEDSIVETDNGAGESTDPDSDTTPEEFGG